jgi:hypothetical protein
MQVDEPVTHVQPVTNRAPPVRARVEEQPMSIKSSKEVVVRVDHLVSGTTQSDVKVSHLTSATCPSFPPHHHRH